MLLMHHKRCYNTSAEWGEGSMFLLYILIFPIAVLFEVMKMNK